MKNIFLLSALMLLVSSYAEAKKEVNFVQFDFFGVPSVINCKNTPGSVTLEKHPNNRIKDMDSFYSYDCEIRGFETFREGQELGIKIYHPHLTSWDRKGVVRKVATSGTSSNYILFKVRSHLATIDHDDFWAIGFPGGVVSFWPNGTVKQISPASRLACFAGVVEPSGERAVFRNLYFSETGRLTGYDLSNGWCRGSYL